MAWVVTAVTAAIEIGTVAAIATAVAEVGLALTVVGTVTKSKELLGVGKVLSVAGGVTSLVSNLATLGTTALADGAAGATASGIDAAGQTALQEASSQALTNQAVEAGTQAVSNQVQNAGLAELAPNLAQETASSVANSAAGGQGLVSGALDNSAGKALGGFAAPTPISVEQLMTSATPEFGSAASSLGQDMGDHLLMKDVVGGAKPGVFDSVSNFWDKLPASSKTAAIQGGLGALGGLSQAWTAEQRLALEKKIADEKIKTEQAQRTNANAVPTIRFQPVGLVNRAIGG